MATLVADSGTGFKVMLLPTRVTAEETQRQKIKKVEEERQKMEELYLNF